MALAERIATFAAFASVSAITTAVQAVVVSLCENTSHTMRRVKATAKAGSSDRQDADAALERQRKLFPWLNLGAAAVNAATLIPWAWVVFCLDLPKQGYFILPWAAVALSWAALLIWGLSFGWRGR